MTPQTSSTLNPLAAEYNPIPPGVTPSRHAPPPFFLSPPPAAAFHPPPSSTSLAPPPPPPPQLYLSPQIFTYIPSISQQHFHTNYFAPPPPPPPPEVEVATHYGQPGRGSTRRRGGFGGVGGRGRGRERGRESFLSRDEKNGRGFYFNSERRQNNEQNGVGFSKNERFSSTRGMQREENRHKVMPLKRDEETTTVMIKNIPYDCRRQELINLLDEFCWLENEKAGNEGTSREAEGVFTYAYDFLYLPIDFRTKKSRGYAFVNFTNARAVWKFFDAFHMRKKWDFLARSRWPKTIEISCAEVQGKEALVNHFSGSTFECETDEFLPARFSPPRDGSGQPVKLTVVGNRRETSHWKPRKQ